MRIYCIIAILLCPWGVGAQIKDKYVDKNNSSRTVVVKESHANDYQILEEQFGDATMGDIIKITTQKPKEEKEKKAKPESPRISKPKKVEQPKPEQPEPPKVEKKKPEKPYVSPHRRPHGPPPPKTYAKKKRWKPVKRKRIKGKRYSCFHF